jgi:hypothetical protein
MYFKKNVNLFKSPMGLPLKKMKNKSMIAGVSQAGIRVCSSF